MQILSTCSTLRNEGLPILWCENCFYLDKPRDLETLKRNLPRGSQDTCLVRHLDFVYMYHFNKSRIKEMRSLRMLKTVEFWGLEGSTVGMRPSTAELQPTFDGIYQVERKKAALRALISQRSGVKCLIKHEIWARPVSVNSKVSLLRLITSKGTLPPRKQSRSQCHDRTFDWTLRSQ